MLRLIGPLSLTERHVQRIFGATSRELAIWRGTGHLQREEIRPGVYRYPTTEVERFANTPGPGADRARERIPRRRVPQVGQINPHPAHSLLDLTVVHPPQVQDVRNTPRVGGIEMPVMDLSTPAVESEFNLDVCVVTDVARGDTAVPCGTNDGCAPTCASACNSGA